VEGPLRFYAKERQKYLAPIEELQKMTPGYNSRILGRWYSKKMEEDFSSYKYVRNMLYYRYMSSGPPLT
jgi:hypothetical protein